MRRFLAFLFNLQTYEQSLIIRLLDQNQALLDRLLEREGIEPIQAVAAPRQASPEELLDSPSERSRAIESFARAAASDPELMEQATENARHSPEWRDVVERAETLMQSVV